MTARSRPDVAAERIALARNGFAPVPIRSHVLKDKPMSISGASAGVPFDRALAACPFRTLIGRGTDAEMLSRLGCAVFSLRSQGEPIDSVFLREILDHLGAGRTVLVAADRRQARDYLKREILAMAGPARGRA